MDDVKKQIINMVEQIGDESVLKFLYVLVEDAFNDCSSYLPK